MASLQIKWDPLVGKRSIFIVHIQKLRGENFPSNLTPFSVNLLEFFLHVTYFLILSFFLSVFCFLLFSLSPISRSFHLSSCVYFLSLLSFSHVIQHPSLSFFLSSLFSGFFGLLSPPTPSSTSLLFHTFFLHLSFISGFPLSSFSPLCSLFVSSLLSSK